MLNFLALLGWSLDETNRTYHPGGAGREFLLERISRTAAIFNQEKLDWMNGVYIRGLAVDDLTGRVFPFWKRIYRLRSSGL